MKNKIIKRIINLSLFALLCTGLVLYFFFDLYLTEDIYVEKGSYKYSLLISEPIKKVPVYKPRIGSVKYHYSAGDGNKPQSDSLEFDTNEPKQSILDFYQKYLYAQGYKPTQPDNVTNNNIIFGSDTDTFNVYVHEKPELNEVTIYHIGQ